MRKKIKWHSHFGRGTKVKQQKRIKMSIRWLDEAIHNKGKQWNLTCLSTTTLVSALDMLTTQQTINDLYIYGVYSICIYKYNYKYTDVNRKQNTIYAQFHDQHKYHLEILHVAFYFLRKLYILTWWSIRAYIAAIAGLINHSLHYCYSRLKNR